MSWKHAILAGCCVAVCAQAAGATQISVAATADLQSLAPGDAFEIRVGLDDVSEVGAYTLDIAFDGPLLFLSSTQLASEETSAGIFEAVGFTLDPSLGLVLNGEGRASVLTVSTLFLDGRTNSPEADPRNGFFAIRFEAAAPGSGQIQLGFLDSAADFVSMPGGGGIPLSPSVVDLDFQVVPEPGSALLVAAGLLALSSRRARCPAEGLC